MKNDRINDFRESVHRELNKNIIPFWINYSVDESFGGFYGRIDNDLKIFKKARKSLILTARVLWTFSALYRIEKNNDYLKIAEHGYRFLNDKLIDRKYGGSFWLVDYEGNVLETKKKIYGQAFSIYALVEYFLATKDEEALKQAVNIFNLIENNNHDTENGGYFEAANRDWSATEEMRLSEVDMNEVKSMNTHLHLMEAYTNLYRVWADARLKSAIRELISIFINHIIDKKKRHLQLFFDEVWGVKSDIISFGHDIEASWLLCESAELLGDKDLLSSVRDAAVKLVDAVIEDGFSDGNAIYIEMNGKGEPFKNIQWWQQAEAVVGLLNAFEISGDEKYFNRAFRAWRFIEKYFVDRKRGEWFYEVNEEKRPTETYYKVSEWKGPYHNSRACMEIMKRLGY